MREATSAIQWGPGQHQFLIWVNGEHGQSGYAAHTQCL